MWQDAGQMWQEAFVNGKKALGLDGLGEAVQDALVQVAVLVVQPGHDGVWRPCQSTGMKKGVRGMFTWRMHDNTHNKTAGCTAGKIQRRALLHPEVPHQPSLREKVCRQLHRAPEARPDHGRANATIQTAHTLALVDLRQAIPRIPVVVLRPDRPERRVALQPRLDQEERTAGRSTDDARPRAAKHVDAQALLLFVLEYDAGQGAPHGLVESQPAPVQQDLVDVGASQPPVDAAQPLVAHNDRHAVDGAPVVVWLVALVLELALELHANLDGLEGVCGRHGAACGDAAGEEGAEGKSGVSGRLQGGSCLGHCDGGALTRLL